MSPEIQKPSFGGSGPINKPLMPQEKKPLAKPTPAPKPEDKSIFGGRPYIERRENVFSWAKSDKAYRATGIPQQEREKIAKELFNKDYLKPGSVAKTLKDLKAKEYQAPTQKEKDRLRKEIKFIEKGILGK